MHQDSRTGSYRQIVKSSTIIGGGQSINYVIGMVRVKIVALLLGPSGVGLIGLYMSAIELVGSIMRFGMTQSAVREIADANGRGDEQQIAHTAATLRRACLVGGTIAWAVTAAFAYPLSLWAFGSPERAWALSILGLSLLFTMLAEGQTALLQGTRRIGDLARINVISAVLSTLLSIVFYAQFGERAIVVVLVLTGVTSMAVSWWFYRRVELSVVSQGWKDTWQQARGLLRLGIAFMWSTAMAAFAALFIRTIIVRELGVDANGMYQAGWALSSVFGSMLVGAMSTDFYPRLTALVERGREAVHLVNEQIEIGILLGLPGLLATMVFAEWAIKLFYSDAFLLGASLLQFFVFSVFFTLISYPMGYILVGKGAAYRYALITTSFHVVHIVTAAFLIEAYGLLGVAIANPVLGFLYVFGMRAMAAPLIDFSWSMKTLEIMVISFVVLVMGFAVSHILPPVAAELCGLILSCGTMIYCLRAVVQRIGSDHRIVRYVCRLPFGRRLCGV